MAGEDILQEPVQRFVDEITPALTALANDIIPGVPPGKAPQDVAVEACNLVAAFIDSDGRQTDAELWAYLRAFGPRLPSMLQYAGPAQVREARLVEGKRTWLAAPSLLFDVLVQADRARGSRHAWTYYHRAMEIAHAVCAADAVPSEAELGALERFRAVLLRAIDNAGLPRPGAAGTAAATRDPGRAPVATAGDEQAPPAPEPELPPARPLEELLDELDGLIGLAAVKAEVKLVANLIQVQNLRRERGLPVVDTSRHLVFTGNPGTGKTTVARLLSQIFRTLGVVAKGHLVETDRSGLVAGYVGQTALKTREVFESALGGVLLIDEAYALARGSEQDFGREAIDTLVKMVEDHRDEIVVIVAGYPREMATFVDANPGLRSRLPKTIHFPDYSTDELVAIFDLMCRKAHYTLTADARLRLREFFDAQPRDKGFGNGRLARNLFESSLAHHASRVVAIDEPSTDQLMTIEPADIVAPVPEAPPPAPPAAAPPSPASEASG